MDELALFLKFRYICVGPLLILMVVDVRKELFEYLYNRITILTGLV